MPLRIEDYALIGDTQTAALVGRDGSIDWLCLPRFDSGACFAALLGDERHGRWRIAPAGPAGHQGTRRYVEGTLVLETTFASPEGEVQVVDFMPPRGEAPDVVRIVRGVRGRVAMEMDLAIRFDYGHVVPWVRRVDGDLRAVAGPDAVHLRTSTPTRGHELRTVADFAVGEGEEAAFVLTWFESHRQPPRPVDARAAERDTIAFWREWSDGMDYDGPYAGQVQRSLVTLKAMTYGPTGGIVAAPTTSLPEWVGGVRNWDYRFCWLRDATLTLLSLIGAGYVQEAGEWRDWLLRAVAGRPSELQIMYGCAGERRLPEFEVGWLPGYEGSAPVRVGNAAAAQFQLDVYGEVMDALHQARLAGLEPDPFAWRLQTALLDFLEGAWQQPDEGIWEIRGPRQHFVHSKVMSWVAFDRAARTVTDLGLSGEAARWRRRGEEVRRDVLARGFDADRNTFVQAYGSRALDASLLLMAQVGFLPATDPRVLGTIDAICDELCSDGFVMRYAAGETDDGLPPGEGAFLPCTFWLVDALALAGRRDEARARFEQLLAIANDVGLLAEEYDTAGRRLVGNFPQAFTHIGLVNSALNLARGVTGPGQARRGERVAG